ncbi:MAG: GAF domain-containing protein [Chloroflexota bacterium]|nr:GAF domain-containing protein [Chloroflexota bacterium]
MGAARMLGVHPNTVRAWTDQGRLRCRRINERGDRRYRAADLQGFLHSAAPGGGLPEEPAGVGLTGAAKIAGRPGVLAGPLAISRAIPTEASRRHAASPADPVAGGRLALLAELSRLCASTGDGDAALRAVAATLRSAGGFEAVAIGERLASGIKLRIVDASARRKSSGFELDARLVEVCLRDGRPIAAPRSPAVSGVSGRWRQPAEGSGAVEIYVPVSTSGRAWGVLAVESPPERPLDRHDLDLLRAVGSQLAMALGWGHLRGRLREQRAQSQALAKVTTELSCRLELPAILTILVDHAMTLFDAQRSAVYLLRPDGRLQAHVTRDLSEAYVAAVTGMEQPFLGATVLGELRAVAIPDFAVDPRSAELRDAVLAEGYDTLAIAPLVADGEAIGTLALYHDRRREWDQDDLQVLEAFGAQAGTAVKNARNYEQMAGWAAQLQSIQQLGTRLTRLTTVADIGQAIASELRQLIDYHNVRVYRVRDQEVVPVAWRGEIGEYTDENDDQLRLRVGEGITGWVALHGQAQYLPNAATDPRSQTIPGTEDDLDESMLLAPMLYEDRVIGVIVLSRLGIDQFPGGDSVRLLEIYASLAAQAMANADVTEQLQAQSERLARQVASQKELMRATESILSTLDPQAVMESMADRLGALVPADNLFISAHDAENGLLEPILARGADSAHYFDRTLSDDEGVSGWILQHGEAQLVPDQLTDPRVAHFEALGPQAGALIVAPLRARDRVSGLVTLERLGPDAAFTEEEFELVQLFSGHVSIALQNAQAHRAVEIRAQTDALTGLKNHGTFVEYLTMATERKTPFSLLLIDLDDFKSFNDRRGHEAGNQLLAGIGAVLRGSCRDSDEVFRYGGDEFAMVLPNSDIAGAAAVAEKVRRAVADVRTPGSRRRSGVTCSIGVATFPADGQDRRSLMVAADRACYAAKHGGRNRIATAAKAGAPQVESTEEPHLGRLIVDEQTGLQGA